MCNYIKDNGEQCRIDTDPFCRHHEDSEQAEEYNSDDDFASAAFNGAQSDFNGVVMETTCTHCETPLRRTERLREHPNIGHRRVFEAVVKCDCSETVIASTSTGTSNIPDGWLDG